MKLFSLLIRLFVARRRYEHILPSGLSIVEEDEIYRYQKVNNYPICILTDPFFPIHSRNLLSLVSARCLLSPEMILSAPLGPETGDG